MKLLDLFSGIGGFSLGLEKAGFETIAFCEIEPYAQKVLRKHWADVPIAKDVTKLTYREGVLYDGEREIYRGAIDAICGGFPCQDISVAGNQKGIGEGTRSGLWSECARLLGEIRPRYAIFENVTALLSGERGDWFKRVLWDISQVGYDAEWHCIPASELGANHHRDRVWIIAYTQRIGQQRQGAFINALYKEAGEFEEASGLVNAFQRKALPYVCRRHHGISEGSHRLRCLGNAVVPQIPELIGMAIMEVESD